MSSEKKIFSVCIPVYNNANNLPLTFQYILDRLNLFDKYEIEIIMVNDGSTDDSYEVMKQIKSKHPHLVKIATLTRNFGQGACTHACYEMARGDVVGIISADGQDPFELFVDMLKEWEKGYKLVLATRDAREDKGMVVGFSKLFHKMLHKINSEYPIGGFDFAIMDREVIQKYLSIDQVDSMGQLKLLWLGYKKKILHYVRKERNAGKSGYKIIKKVGLAANTLLYESAVPIHSIAVGGGIGTVISFVYLIVTIILKMCGVMNISVFSYVISLQVMGTCVIAACIGIVGEYVWNQFRFIKQLPRYVMEEKDE